MNLMLSHKSFSCPLISILKNIISYYITLSNPIPNGTIPAGPF